MNRILTLATAALVLPLALSACGSSDSKGTASSTSGATSASASPTTEATSAPAPTSAPVTSAAAAKLDANKASEEDMVKAFIDGGMKEAAAKKWADEVKEYRPYTKADLSSKLASKLAKYKIPASDMAIIMKTVEVK